jgi:hypothetical protein
MSHADFGSFFEAPERRASPLGKPEAIMPFAEAA